MTACTTGSVRYYTLGTQATLFWHSAVLK